MAKLKHTKGEWELRTNRVFIKDTYNSICTVEIQRFEPFKKDFIDEEAVANAKLIVAAPILIEGLQMIVDKRNSAGWDAECCALLAEQLIKKATE